MARRVAFTDDIGWNICGAERAQPVATFWDARHTQPGRARDLADQLSAKIRLGEFSVSQVLVKDLRPVPAVCVIGRP